MKCFSSPSLFEITKYKEHEGMCNQCGSEESDTKSNAIYRTATLIQNEKSLIGQQL